ncbi:hypothetical protein V7266_13945 [Neobacillus drentensis]|uniref:hypothetical protein n=1 Tax=Neobacillus drentensis TaxID=220684 RepID=UPI002FFF1678
MAEFEVGQDPEKQEGREEQNKEDRFTSFMFGPRRNNNRQRDHNHPEPKQNHSTINYDELMTNIDTLVESVRGLRPLFSKVFPFIEQLWKKK